jgi:hypothetical protein
MKKIIILIFLFCLSINLTIAQGQQWTWGGGGNGQTIIDTVNRYKYLDPATARIFGHWVNPYADTSNLETINNIIIALKSDGTWDLLSDVGYFRLNDSNNCEISWKKNKLMGSNGCTFIPNVGIKGSTTGAIRWITNLNPTADNLCTQDNASFGCYVATAPTTTDNYYLFTIGSVYFGIEMYRGTDYYPAINSAQLAIHQILRTGLQIVSRTQADSLSFFLGYNNYYTKVAAPSILLVDVTIILLGWSQGGNNFPCDAVISYFFIGTGLTESNMLTIKNAFK